jgi:hypothetical protein
MLDEMEKEPIDPEPDPDPPEIGTVGPVGIDRSDLRDQEQPRIGELDGGVEAIRTILDLVGLNISDRDMTQVVEDLFRRWDRARQFSPNEMSLQDIQRVLEWAEMDVRLVENGTSYDVFDVLSLGKQVILEVDIGEVTGRDFFFSDFLFGQDADHVCIIKDFDLSDPNNPTVTLYALDGSAKEGLTIPLSVLMDAWADGNHAYLEVDPSELEDSGQPAESPVESRQARASDA